MKRSVKRYLSMIMAFALLVTGVIPAYAADTADGAPSVADHVLINQVYGNGGGTNAVYTHDFVELYNPTANAVDLTGWSLQYAAADKGKAFKSMPLSGTVKAGQRFLIQLASGSVGVKLPTPDLSSTLINLSGSNGKVALASKPEPISGITDPAVIDFVGYGTASEFEGTAVPALSGDKAAVRKALGVDTNNNLNDFEVATPNPQNSAPSVETKCATPTASTTPSAVNLNTIITFTTTTLGAAIEYNTVSKTDGSWTTGSAVTVTADTTYYVRAVKAGLETSDVATFAYTVDTTLRITASSNEINAISGATLKLTANDPSAKIYYTIDGTDVSKDSKVYETGIKLEGAIGDKITLKAIAMAEGRANSDVFMRVYTIKDPNDVMTVKDIFSLTPPAEGVKVDVEVKGTIAYFATGNANPVIHTVADGKTYGLYVFGSAPAGAKIGDLVRFKGKYEIRYNMPQLSGIVSSVVIGPGEKIEPKEMTISDILTNGSNLLGHVVKIKAATLGKYNASGSTPISDASGNSINIYKPTAYPVQVLEGDVVDVYAMVAKNNSTIQLYTGTKKDNGYNVYDVTIDTKAPVVTLRDSYSSAKPSQDYMISVKAEDNKDIKDVKITYTIGTKTVSNQVMVYTPDNGDYNFTIPGNDITKNSETFSFTVTATDVTGLVTVTPVQTVLIDARPQIDKILPARNSSTGDVKTPVIAVTLSNAGDKPVVTLTLKKDNVVLVNEQKMLTGAEANVFEYQTAALSDGTHTATVSVKREDGFVNAITWNFTVGTPQFKAYFGQLHGHTAEYSDGSGTLANGLSYLKSLPQSEKVDFVSFTDHSNYFDTTTEANPAAAMNDKTKMTAASLVKWNNYVSDMQAFNGQNAGSLVAFPGYEMTWSGGPGHINTFNSVGIVSRNNKDLNNKTADAGLKAYYDELIKNPDPLSNLSQFNHPGATFGTFADFAYWSPSIDNKMVAVEVGNGEGAIGSGGYFPSYSEYTKALDKGWHVAPSNNQDNHKGRWGNANTARTVIITNELSQNGLLKGLKNRSAYATEDNNLNVQYTVNDQMMGSVISETPTTPLQFYVNIDDADQGDTISKVEIVSNSGRIVKSKTFDKNAVEWTFEMEPVQGYYYVRVTQADKNIAVTAPVWIGQAPRVGISSVEVGSKMPVTNENVTVSTTLFNNEAQPATVKSIEYSIGKQILKTDMTETSIASTGSYKHTLDYTPVKPGIVKITATAVILVNSQEKIFTQDVELNVRDSEKLVYIGIDASHYNEYVRGNYKDSMGNFANLAMNYDVRVVELATSEALIEATQNEKFKMLILTPPTRRNGINFLIGYQNYKDEEIAAVKAFAESGKTVIVAGWSDNYENYKAYSNNTPYTLPAADHMSAQQNKLLAALGSTLRISDDEVCDNITNGGSAQRLYLKNYNLENTFLKGVKPAEQVYSNYGGATIYAVDADKNPTSALPATVSPMVFGFTTTISKDSDKDGTTGTSGSAIVVPKYSDMYMVAASESVTYGNGKTATIFAAGSVFMSNFEIKAELDSWATPEYSNYTIFENIIKMVNPVVLTDISKVHAAQEGEIFTIEGMVTSNASGYDKDTAFFDTVYVQDGTAGIDVFPVAGDIRAGQIVQIKGVTSSYNGERQLNVQKLTIIDPSINLLPEPIILTTAQAAKSEKLGSLVKISGKINKLEFSNGVIESIFVTDNSNVTARVFIDGYITKDKTIANLKEGASITVIGLSSIDTEGARIRVRDRADVVCTRSQQSDKPEKEDRPSSTTGTVIPTPTLPTSDKTPVNTTIKPMTQGEGTIVKNSAGETKLTLMIESKKLDAQLKDQTTTIIQINAGEEKGLNQVTVQMNPELFKSAELANKTVEVKTETARISIAPGSLKLLSDKPVALSANTVGEIEKATIMGNMPKNNFVSVGGFIDFSFETVDGLKSSAVEFLKPMVITMNFDASKVKNIEKVGVYNLNEKTNKWEFVGSKMNAAGELVFSVNHFSTYAIMESNKVFKDSVSWAKNPIEVLAARQLISGISADQFAPERKVTRAEFAQMIVASLNLKAKDSKTTFKDVKADKWYKNAVGIAADHGIVVGSKGNFNPDAELTREQMFKMINKAVKLSGSKTATIESTEKTITGDATRAQAAVVIYNLLKSMGEI